MKLYSAAFLLLLSMVACQSQKDKHMTTNNPLICDPVTGVCELPGQDLKADAAHLNKTNKPITVLYFTDPICSSCWGIEPQLKKLKLEYGNELNIEYHMGGLLPDWSYNSGGISKPSDVAHHWDEVSAHYDMPIDGDVWLEDPLHSSYPPSIAFKAAQMQNEEKAILFLRKIREMVFLQKMNITKWEHLKAAGDVVGLDTAQLKKDYESTAKNLFQDDLNLAKSMGVRGFPSVFFVDSLGNQEFVYGFRPYQVFEQAVLKTHPTADKSTYDKSWQHLFKHFGSLTTREFSELSGMDKQESETMLKGLHKDRQLNEISSKNGSVWINNQ